MKNVSTEQPSSVLLTLLEKRLNKNLTSVIMFGSRIKGDYKPTSDYDFLIVCKKLPNPIATSNMITDIVSDVLFKTGHRVSPILLSEDQLLEEVKLGSPLLSSLLIGYRIIYDKEKFTAKALETLKNKTSTTYKERGKTWVLRRIA